MTLFQRRATWLGAMFAVASAVTLYRADGTSQRAPVSVDRTRPVVVPEPRASRPTRIDLHVVSKPLQATRKRLEVAIADGDLSADDCESLIRDLVAALRDDALRADVISMLKQAVDMRAELAAELIATAVGRARVAESLDALMTAIDGIDLQSNGASLFVFRLVVSLFQDSAKPTGEGITSYIRFSALSSASRVEEEAVRAWSTKKLRALMEGGGDAGSAVVVEALVLGLTRGEISPTDAETIGDLIMSADATTLRANLFESLHLTRSRDLRRRLADYLRSGRARNAYEARMGASALVKILDQDTVDVLVDLLQPRADEMTVAAVLEALPATPRPRADMTALATRVHRIAFDERDWGANTRVLAARALVNFSIPNGIDVGGAERALRAVAFKEFSAPLREALAGVAAEIRKDQTWALEEALGRVLAAPSVCARLVEAFDRNRHITEAGRKEFKALAAQKYPRLTAYFAGTRGNARIVGVVMDWRSRRRGDLVVTVRRPGAMAAVASAVTDERGQFAIEGLQSGRYELACREDKGSETVMRDVTTGTGPVILRLKKP